MSNVVEHCTAPQPEGYACTRENYHQGPCACVPNQAQVFPAWPRTAYDPSNLIPQLTPPQAPATIPQSIFDNFGGNWRWASIDYRGVARVHTFEPTFTASGRIEVPRGKGNSATCEAFDMVDSPPSPIWVSRVNSNGRATDRFGIQLPTGADPVEAADVVQAPTMASLNLEPVPMTLFKDGFDNPKYHVARTERCRCTITSVQLATLISQELNIGIDGVGPFTIVSMKDADTGGVALTVEWERHL
jgi:hypothetical protein